MINRRLFLAALLLSAPSLQADSLDAAGKAELHFSRGDWDLAEKEASKAAAIAGSARAYELLGEAKEAQGNFEGAAQAYEKAGKKGSKAAAARAKALSQDLASAPAKPKPSPTPKPSPEATPLPTAAPSTAPTAAPTAQPTAAPTEAPSPTPLPPTAVPTLAPTPDPSLQKKEAELEEAKAKADAERKALEEERARLAEEKRKLEEERARLQETRPEGEKAKPEAKAGGKRGGITFMAGYWSPRILEVIYRQAGSCDGCSFPPIYDGPRSSMEFNPPLFFGVGIHSKGWVLENAFNVAEGALWNKYGSSNYEIRGALAASWLASLGYDWRILGPEDGFSLYLPLRLEGGATWITVRDQVFFGPNAGLAAGLGAKWRLGQSLALDLSGRYHMGMEVSGLNSDNGDRYEAGGNEVLTDASGISINLGLDWLVW